MSDGGWDPERLARLTFDQLICLCNKTPAGAPKVLESAAALEEAIAEIEREERLWYQWTIDT